MGMQGFTYTGNIYINSPVTAVDVARKIYLSFAFLKQCNFLF